MPASITSDPMVASLRREIKDMVIVDMVIVRGFACIDCGPGFAVDDSR